MHVYKLLEGLSEVLFFYTLNDSAYNIVTKGYVDLGMASRNEYEENLSKRGKYFLSTTRSRMGEFHKTKSGGTLFTLDGNRLRQKYSGGPTDYFHGSKTMPDEMEDRIITNQSKISLLDYVTRADVHWSDHAKAVYVALRKRNIPVFVYKDRKDWLLGNTKKAMKHSEIIEDQGRVSVKPSSYDEAFDDTRNILDTIFKFYNSNDYDDLSREDRIVVKEMLSNRGGGLKRTLNNIGLRWKKREQFSAQIEKINRILKRENLSNIAEFADMLKNKLENLHQKKVDRQEKERMIETLGKLTKMMDAINSGQDPIESATKHVNNDIKDYPVVLEHILSKLFSNVTKFYTDKLEDYIKNLFPILKRENFAVGEQYNNYRAEAVMRDLGIDV